MHVDVAILGAGPAGAATALELARLGLSAAMIDNRTAPEWKVGEGLPAEVRPLLQHWGLWERFLAGGGHLPCPVSASAWGSAVLVERPAVLNPYGPGYHLDRAGFDAMLADAATQAGALLLRPARVVGLARTGASWLVDLGVNGSLRAQFLVDATGRTGRLARQLGGVRRHVDRLVAVCCLLAGDAGHDLATLVESVPTGWWYTASVPGARRVIMYFTDSDLMQTRAVDRWEALLGETLHVRRLTTGLTLCAGPRLVAAGSSCLDDPAGDGWLAVGDAAAAFDPLSSQGLITALSAGREAARAIAGADFNAYRALVAETWSRYVRRRSAYYGMERRWPEEPFWRRRYQVSRAG